jgi:hypothetical protein
VGCGDLQAHGPSSEAVWSISGVAPALSFTAALFTDGGPGARPEEWRLEVTRSGLSMCLAMGLLLCMVTEAEAVANDKARLIASTELKVRCGGVFPPEWGRSPEGRIRSSDAAFLFSSGSRSLTIPYGHIESLKYGRVTRQEIGRFVTPCPDASFVDVPRDYYPIVHDLLTMGYRDARGVRQTALLWLGDEMVASTLANLDQHGQVEIKFDRIGACVQYKTPDECGDGYPRTLKGLTRVFIDVDVGPYADQEARSKIVSEIERAGLKLEFLDSRENAQVVLRFVAEYEPGDVGNLVGIKFGTGWLYLVQGQRLREVYAFHDEKQSIVTRMPATNFGRAFVREYKRANGQ